MNSSGQMTFFFLRFSRVGRHPLKNLQRKCFIFGRELSCQIFIQLLSLFKWLVSNKLFMTLWYALLTMYSPLGENFQINLSISFLWRRGIDGIFSISIVLKLASTISFFHASELWSMRSPTFKLGLPTKLLDET